MQLADFPCSSCRGSAATVLYPDTRGEKLRDSSAFRCTNSGYGSHFRIVRCTACGFVFCSPRPIADDISELYSEVEDPTYVKEIEGRTLTFARRAASVAKHHEPHGRLLDVGAYAGAFVAAANDLGFDAEGIEPSAWAASIAQQSGLKITQGTLETHDFLDNKFDVLTLWDVIEHLSDPLSVLEKSAFLLKPGGLIVVHTMDIDSLAARLMRSRWPWFMEMHLHYFSKKSLSAMLEKTGFEVIRIASEGRFISIGYLVTRVEAITGRWIGVPLTWLVRIFRLEATQIPINLGDLVTAYAKKI